MSDSKPLRRYQAGVERALGLFDATNEWADYIAFLSRLLKALQAAPAGAGVPSKAILAKYLAQCLSPSLPAGVHQKALEVYGVIFTLLNKDGLAKDLPLYLPGISHTLSFASLGTRPWFLTLYDDHILQLSSKVLRPALKALILSLLPGIEEENSEDFEQNLATLNRLRAAFAKEGTEEIFWQSLFLASITSPNRRMGVLVYLSRYLPKLDHPTSTSDAVDDASKTNGVLASTTAVTAPEPGLLIRCFATGLQDEHPLVQRGFLDLLVTNLPLQAATLQDSGSANDLDILTSSAMSIVLRRDMSLNRRLWAWFFGSDEKIERSDDSNPYEAERSLLADPVADVNSSQFQSGSRYFSDFGMITVIRTFKKMLSRISLTPSQRARPFRMLISLMDRNSIGGPVVDALFESLLQDLKTYQTNAPSQQAFDEVFRSANVFFDSIEPRVVARNLLKLIKSNNLDVVEFIGSNFNLDDDEMGHNHLHAIAFVLSQYLVDLTKYTSDAQEPPGIRRLEQVVKILDLSVPLLGNATHRLVQVSEWTQNSSSISTDLIYRYYDALITGTRQSPPLPVEQIVAFTVENVSSIIIRCLRKPVLAGMLDHLTSIFEKLHNSIDYQQAVTETRFVQELALWAQKALGKASIPFKLPRNVARLVAALSARNLDASVSFPSERSELIISLTEDFWTRLNPSTPQHHVECVEAIWALRKISADPFLVDSRIMSQLSRPGNISAPQEHPIVNFGILWTHTKISAAPSATMLNGEGSSPEHGPMSLFKTALLYIIDAMDVGTATDAYRAWMNTLLSLGTHFQAIFESIQQSQKDPQEVTTGLHRLWKLITVTKSSATLWKDFVHPRGSLQEILQLTASIVVADSERAGWALTSLEIIRLVHDGSEAIFDNSLIQTLSERIPRSSSSSPLQGSILDTLQLLVTLNGAGAPPPALLSTLMGGIASPTVDANIDKWITLLCNSIPLYSDAVFFTNLLKLTECFCRRIQSYFGALQSMFEAKETTEELSLAGATTDVGNAERSITNLLSGLEYVLARAHTKVTEAARPTSSSQEPANEVSKPRALANSRLTAVLCMQDAIKVCGQVWYWRPSKTSPSPSLDSMSFNYMSSRLRSKTRRMLENLINAEPQECLETLMGMWVEAVKKTSHQAQVMNLLESLDGARPKSMMPTIFNAIYGRTNPAALDVYQRSTLSVDVTGLELVAFLTDYVDALEDDLLEDIWSDCTSFTRDILANPMPHRQILLRLLEFLSILCQKMENTNFGDQFRMRRELADLCARLFTAVFTIKPGGFDQTSARLPGDPAYSPKTNASQRFSSGNGIAILCYVLPAMSSVLTEADRIATIYAGISTNITGPSLRSRTFPANVGPDVLDLLFIMSKTQSTSKIWRKDILDAFNDIKFFQGDPTLAEPGWLPVLKQLGALEKDLLADVLSRLSPPATAGIMFGVGATAARAEADKQAKVNLRRLALLLMANGQDTFVSILTQIILKVEELLTATPATSPSSSTRGDTFLLLRAVALSFSQHHLVGLWSVIDFELRGIFADINKSAESIFTPYSHMQAAKLLDLLLLTKPEEFQLHEWLYITDTIDAIYPPVGSEPTALADNLSLDNNHDMELQSSTVRDMRKPWLCTDISRSSDAYSTVLGSFFGHLSIRAFEDTYSLEPVDNLACRSDVLTDLFAEGE